MIRFARLLLLVWSLALTLGMAGHGVEAAGMDMTMASAPSALGGQMGDCDTCAGKTMKPSAVCDLMCSATVAIALETPAVLGVFPLLVNYGLIPEVRAVGRVPAVNLSPPRTTFLI